MKLRSRIALLLAFVTTVVAIPMGFSSWVFGSKDASTSVSKSTDYVCYINENMAANRYPTIESAVNAANNSKGNTVYVIPAESGTNVTTIKQDITLLNNTQLVLPYSGTTTYPTGTNAEDSANCGSSGSSTNLFVGESYRRTLVNVADGVTITIGNGSSLLVGGLTGSNSTTYTGHTTGIYTEIKLGENASIVCESGGTLDICGGYITEASTDNFSKITIKDGGTLYTTFIIYDYKGGTNTLGMINMEAGKKYCPFTIFDFVNNQIETIIEHGASFYGRAKLVVSNIFFYNDVPVIKKYEEGTETQSLFLLKNGDISFKYKNVTGDRLGVYSAGSTFENDKSYTEYNLNGDCVTGYFKVSIKMLGISKEVDTSQFDLPFSYKMKINVSADSNVICNSDIKFLPGSKVCVEEGSTVTFNKRVSFYQSFDDKQSVYPYPDNKDAAEFIVNGQCNLSSSSTFGGVIKTSSTSSILNCETTNLNFTAIESNGTHPSQIGAIAGNASGHVTTSIIGQVYNYSSDKTNATNPGVVNILNSRPIYSVVDISSALYWTISNTSYTIKLLSNDGSSEIGSYTFTNDTTSYVLPGSVGDGELVGWTRDLNSTTQHYEPSATVDLYNLLPYFLSESGRRVLNLYAILDNTEEVIYEITVVNNSGKSAPGSVSYNGTTKTAGTIEVNPSTSSQLSFVINKGFESGFLIWKTKYIYVLTILAESGSFIYNGATYNNSSITINGYSSSAFNGNINVSGNIKLTFTIVEVK